MEDVKLHVENLRISFHTNDGKLQAVRGINFDLHKGETLAIVGESGSGKSVTSKAVLGILSGNSIVEDGEILYDGMDLLKISEDDFHKIRGDKIAMIFQDPMSSLNPIVKIGRQLTEAMILKGKSRQKQSKKHLSEYLSNLKVWMVKSGQAGNAAEVSALIDTFNKVEPKHLELEGAYNKAYQAAVENQTDLADLIIELEKNAADDLVYRLRLACRHAKESVHPYVVHQDVDNFLTQARFIEQNIRSVTTDKREDIVSGLKYIARVTDEALTAKAPDFWSMAYWLVFAGQDLPQGSIEQVDQITEDFADKSFLNGFREKIALALRASAAHCVEEMRTAVDILRENRSAFDVESPKKADWKKAAAAMSEAVERTPDVLALEKDSSIYTFASSLDTSIDKYFTGEKNNPLELQRFDKQTAKQEEMLAKGKTPDSAVMPAYLIDLTAVRNGILKQIDRLTEKYLGYIRTFENGDRDFDAEAVAFIDYLKKCAAGVVKKVTPAIARDRAIKLMKEVGIHEPRRRFDQYPFEFSGGMRQRIVIAIALAADPDILICDEPTTALDVTIQSQILELINKLKAERHLSVIFITHDLGVVANMADRIAVMYAGKIVEIGTSTDIFYESAHPYTWALMSSMPDLDTNEKLEAIPGTPPDMHYPPVGDAFAERNKYALKIDFEQQPPMFKISDTHYAATWLLHPDAPKVDRPKIITDRIERMRNRRGERTNESVKDE